MFRRLTISMSKSCVCTNNVYLKFFLQKSSFTVYMSFYPIQLQSFWSRDIFYWEKTESDLLTFKCNECIYSIALLKKSIKHLKTKRYYHHLNLKKRLQILKLVNNLVWKLNYFVLFTKTKLCHQPESQWFYGNFFLVFYWTIQSINNSWPDQFLVAVGSSVGWSSWILETTELGTRQHN